VILKVWGMILSTQKQLIMKIMSCFFLYNEVILRPILML
jgi:hypothetical protein